MAQPTHANTLLFKYHRSDNLTDRLWISCFGESTLPIQQLCNANHCSSTTPHLAFILASQWKLLTHSFESWTWYGQDPSTALRLWIHAVHAQLPPKQNKKKKKKNWDSLKEFEGLSLASYLSDCLPGGILESSKQICERHALYWWMRADHDSPKMSPQLSTLTCSEDVPWFLLDVLWWNEKWLF